MFIKLFTTFLRQKSLQSTIKNSNSFQQFVRYGNHAVPIGLYVYGGNGKICNICGCAACSLYPFGGGKCWRYNFGEVRQYGFGGGSGECIFRRQRQIGRAFVHRTLADQTRSRSRTILPLRKRNIGWVDKVISNIQKYESFQDSVISDKTKLFQTKSVKG